MTTLQANVVGMHFRPPAKDVISLLPIGTKLIVQREPDNEYDSNACKVLLPDFAADSHSEEIQTIYKANIELCNLLDQGEIMELPFTRDSLTNPFHLGYIDSKKTGMAAEFSTYMDSKELTLLEGTLIFSPTGTPMFKTEIEAADVDFDESDESDYDDGRE